MYLLDHVKPEEAEGKVKDAYSIFPEGMPTPEPLVMMSVSPEIVSQSSGVIRYFMTHEKLDMGLLATIRYLVASEFNHPFCINMNSGILKMAGGLSDEDLEALKADPQNAPVDDSQKALIAFVMKAVKTPEAVQKSDIEALNAMGWSDKDIFEATYHATNMVASSILYKSFVKP